MNITLYYIVTRLPHSLHLVRDHFLSVCPTTLTVYLLEERLLAAETSIVAVGASCGDPRTPVFEGCSPSPLLPSVASAAAADLGGFESVGAASAPSERRRTGKGKGGKGAGGTSWGGGGGGGGSGGGGGGSGSGGEGGGVGGSSGGGRGSRGGGASGGSGGGGGSGGSGGGGGGGGGGGSGGAGHGSAQRSGSGGGPCQQQQRSRATLSPQQLREWYAARQRGGGTGLCTYFPDATEIPRWGELSRAGVAIFDLDYDDIIAAMYDVSYNAEGDCYLCVPPDPGIEATALGTGEAAALGARASAAPGAGVSVLSGTASSQAFHTFTLDSGASRSFFRDRTTLTPLSRPVAVSLADPSGGPVLASFSTVLPCPAAPSGTLSGLYLPSFSTNLVSGADLQNRGVDQFTRAGQRVTHCTCARTGQHLATFGRRLGSSLYTLTTASPPVTESGQIAASSQVFAAASRSGPESAPCSCRLLSHQTLLWHHLLGHPSLPRLRGMASRVLVSGLPRSLPPLPLGPAPTCVPCIEGRQRATPHSSEFPPTEAPLQTLHMDVWGPARVRGQGHERFYLLVVDDYSRYTTVFPLRNKGDVTEVLIDWIRGARLQLRERFGSDFPVLRLHSDRGEEFSSPRLGAFCRAQGICQTFTLPASPHKNGIAERRIGMVMDVARTSMIHAAAPHFLWPFAVQYTAHQLNLQPQVSLPETSPTLRWTGQVGDASAFRLWGSWAFVRDLSTDKLSPRAVPCVFLGFPPNAPGLQFYHPTSRRVLSSQDVTFDESVPYYRLFPYRTAPLPSPPLFLAQGPPPVDPLPPQGPARSGVSQVDAVEPVEEAVDSGAVRGAEPGGAGSRGAASGGAEPGGAEPGGAESGGAEPGGAGSGGAEPGGGEPGGAGSTRVASRGTSSRRELLSPQELREWFAQRWSRGAGAGCTPVDAGFRGTRTGGTGAVGAGGAAEAAGVGPAGGSTGATGGTGVAGPAGTGAAGATGAGAAGGVGAGGSRGAGKTEGAGVGAVGARGAAGAGAAAGGTGAVPAGSGDATRPRPYIVPLLEEVLGLPTSTGSAPPLACPPPVASQSQLQPASSLPAPSPYTGPTGGLTERREPMSRPALPVCAARTSRCAPRPRPPTVPGTHQMTLRPSTAPLRVPLPSPPMSSLPALADPESDSLRAASPTVTRLLATVVTDPSFESTTTLVAESASVSPPSVGGECALSTDVLEDRQEEFQCFSAALPHLVSTLTAPEGDPDAPDIPTPRSYAEAIEGPYSSQWQSAMDAEMASWKSTGTYVNDVPPPGANIVSGMWIFRVKRPPGSPLVFKARYVARGFSQRQGVDYFQNFSPTPKMTTLRVLQRFEFTYSSPQATPLSTRHSFSALPSDESVEPSGPYLELVGCLMYLMTCTRPNLAYPLSILARYVAPRRHRPEHMAAAKRVLRYLCSTSGLELVLGGRSPAEHRLEHRTKHIALRYFLARELQQRGQLSLAYVASEANTADIFTKALPPDDHQRFCTMLGRLLRKAKRAAASRVSHCERVALSAVAGGVGAAPDRVVLPEPPASSLLHVPDPESDLARAASPTITRLPVAVTTDPDFESTAWFALVIELVDFSARSRLDYVASFVTESESVCPPSVGDPDALDIPTPRSYAEAIAGEYSSQWQTAMDAEMASWKSTSTYIDEVPPPGANIVDGMLIFRVKRPPGSPPAFKVHYIARGFSQREGVNFFQTFSPTPKMTTLWPSQGDLAAPPTWLHWVVSCGTTLAALGFSPSSADPSLFLRTDTTLPPFYVLTYVDDLVFATADTEALALLNAELQERHTCCYLGELRSYLGLQITRDRSRRTITLTQSHMVHQVLQRFSFQFSSPQPTPLSTGHSLSAPSSDESVEPSGPYPELVGCLICEAEIYAGAMAALELRWLTYLLTDLGEPPRSPLVLYVDNKVMLALCRE
ncbi:unnamed protein product [Closterium sp. NIES-54]